MINRRVVISLSTIWTELRSRFSRAPTVQTIGLHAPSLISRPKPRNQGNEGQPGCTHRKSTHTLGNGETTQQPARDSEAELAAAAAAAAAMLQLHDPRCIAEHNPSQQTVSRFVFLGTHAGASNGTAAAAAAGPATGEAKTYVRVYYFEVLDIRRGDDVSTIFFRQWPQTGAPGRVLARNGWAEL